MDMRPHLGSGGLRRSELRDILERFSLQKKVDAKEELELEIRYYPLLLNFEIEIHSSPICTE